MDEKEKDSPSLHNITSITEEISFNDYSADEKEEPSVTEEESKKSDESADDDDGGVVFATVDTKPKQNPHAPKRMKPSKKFPIPKPAMIATAVGVCVVAVGALIVMNLPNGGSSPGVAQSSQSGNHLGSPISEVSYELTNVDTNSITFGNNVTVEGVDLSGKTLAQAFNAMQDKVKSLRTPINIDIKCENDRLTLTENDFKFDSDLTDVLIQAYHLSRGELVAPTVTTTNENGKTDFKLAVAINTESVNDAVKKAAKKFDTPAVDAHVSKFDPDATEKFTYANGSDGYLIDQNSLKTSVEEIITQADKSGSLSIKRIKTPYQITLEQVKANTKLIASHSTNINNRYESNENMKLAVRAASGTEVKPGETFSFNEMTGDTSVGDEHHYANGVVGSYLPSTAIVKGEHVDQYGGGICQASTTIYNCALKADMEVVERHSHQFPSFYASLGLDATVDYGNLDMKFKNNYKYSVFIATYIYDSDGDGAENLNVEMYGPVTDKYDEIVPVGWVTSADSDSYTAVGAKAYFKDGKEIDRELLPADSYDYYSDGFWDITSQWAAENKIDPNPEKGPETKPTYQTPTVYSPNGCGSSSPIEYGTADQYLKQIGS